MIKDKHKIILLKRLLPVIILIICFILSVGYTTVNYITLDIGGNLVAMEQEGVFVTEIKYKDGSAIHYANSNISVVKNSALKHEIALSSTSNTSYITYIITVLNSNKYDCEFKAAIYDEEFYDNEDIIFDLNDSIVEGDLISSGETLDFEITFKYKDGVVASTSNNVLNAYINYEFIPIAMLKSTNSSDKTMFRSDVYKQKIKTISFDDAINVPENAIESWDIGVSETGDVMAYLVQNSSDASYYDLHIQSNTQLYANKDMGYYFSEFKNVDAIYNLPSLNTSKTTSMFYLFRSLGRSSSVFTLDLSGLDTSNVTNMGAMFEECGYSNPTFTLDVSGLDTSSAKSMNYMFESTGYSSTVFTLDVSGFDTSKVTTMGAMFHTAGYNSSVFSLDVSGFDTSNVKDMSYMFQLSGYNNPNFTLDVSSFNTSNVTNMTSMFNRTGYRNTAFTLDVSGFDTSKVTKMSNLFYGTGYYSTVLNLDVSDFDTSNVTDMSYMFYNAGFSSTVMQVDVSGFDTSVVTDMSYMFYQVGYSNPSFTLDVRNFDTTNVTNMESMFLATGYNSTVFTLDVSRFNTAKVTNMRAMFRSTGYTSSRFVLDLSDFDTGNVSDMSYMFYQTGFNNSSFTLDVSGFNTGKVTNMSYMFYKAANRSSVISLDLTNFDTSKVTDMKYMFYSFGFNNYSFTLDLSSFDTSNVTDMSFMFYDLGWRSTVCQLNVSSFDTSKVTNMNTMFDSTCYSSQIFSLDLSGFDTSAVTNMGYMFNNCGNKSPVFNVDVSGFDTSLVTNYALMFRNAGTSSNVFRTTLTISNPNVTTYGDMFGNTAILPGSQILVKYTPETESIVDRMVATKSSGANVAKWYSVNVGNEISIGDEMFNVVSDNSDTISLLAKFNLGADYRQSSTQHSVKFASAAGWDYTPGPKEVDIQVWSSNPKIYVNGYVDYLNGLMGISNVKGDLLTGTQLIGLGCKFTANYAFSMNARTCADSPHYSWLITNQKWWTKSASSNYPDSIWQIWTDGNIYDAGTALTSTNGVRPVITLDKAVLANYM